MHLFDDKTIISKFKRYVKNRPKKILNKYSFFE